MSSASQLLRNNNFVDYASGFNTHFSDSGIFGVTVEGPGSHSRDLLDSAIGQLNGLKNVSSDALVRAKNQLVLDIARTHDHQGDRLEEIAKNYLTTGGQLTFHQYINDVNNVTESDVARAVERVL